MASKVSWPPKDYKLPQQESKNTVFLELLHSIQNYRPGTPKERTDREFWIKRYKNAN
jgi:hypothetical protein